mgnify:CR=1 FL=1
MRFLLVLVVLLLVTACAPKPTIQDAALWCSQHCDKELVQYEDYLLNCTKVMQSSVYTCPVQKQSDNDVVISDVGGG